MADRTATEAKGKEEEEDDEEAETAPLSMWADATGGVVGMGAVVPIRSFAMKGVTHEVLVPRRFFIRRLQCALHVHSTTVRKC